ncbi:MAG TPA: mitofilin family membrane protein, partial [Alphaproteobacteria bacterium]|nr:mitofilin family membrane protein [Alphaproteobacteria bacterium]
ATEVQAMTGDIVVASLKGEDVSVAEKAQARFGEILKVEKDGEMLTGTPVQQKLAKAETLTQNGQLEQAIAELSNLEGPAAQMIQPWLAKARSTLQAQNLSQLLEGGVVEALSGAATGGLPHGGQLVEDPASGVVLYRRGAQFAPPQSFTTP